jgi:hypothetical protein
MEKIVKRAFCLAVGVETQAQGCKEDHNLLGVAPIYERLRLRASKATSKMSSILPEMKILSTLFKSLDFRENNRFLELENDNFTYKVIPGNMVKR